MDWECVKKELEDPKYPARTIRGIASVLGVDQEKIVNIIKINDDQVVKLAAPAETGEPLFTTRDRYRNSINFKTSVFDQFIGANTAISIHSINNS